MVNIRVWSGNEAHIISAEPNETILAVLQRHGIEITSPCGGAGVCQKCAVRTSHGVKLACNTGVFDGMEIYPHNSNEGDLAVLDTYESERAFVYNRASGIGIAIDIGTTTLAFELINMATGQKISSHSVANSQRAIGADVVTRIKRACEGEHAKLQAYIIDDIHQGIVACIKKSGHSANDISHVSIAGNTTMLHLLQGLPCDTLGVSPFTPVDISMRHCAFGDIFEAGLLDAETLILPGISTFVGADIAAGILCCMQDNKPGLLIDLGTNGEMALFTPGRVLVTSTAAGPAFEAGNISMGTASIPGAIAKVRFSPETNVFIYETIDNQPPTGICGTGVVDIAAELIKHGIADETGRLDDEYFDDGITIAEGIVFTQKDMREVQLAKSAVRSGVEILLDVAGIGYNDIGRVFLAGGFGYRINIQSAVTLGLIPHALAGKIKTVGNTSLGGALHVLTSVDAEADIKALVTSAEEINLSTHPRFNDLFMEHMMFE